MSERTTEKQLSRSDRPTVTPQPTRQALFEWVEDKFKGKDSRPRYFELKIAYGPGGAHYRPETLHQIEYKPNAKEPEREQMVEHANKLDAVAQQHCNELGKPQMYVVHAINHIKGSGPYGAYLMKVRPMTHMGGDGGNIGDFDGGESDVQSDGVHRDLLLKQSLEHQRSNDEHTRFMQDSFQKGTGALITLQQEVIRELRADNQLYKSKEMDYFKAIQEAMNQTEDRKMKNDMQRVKMEVIERGVGLLMQMIPVVAKSLERGKNGGALSAAGTPETIEESPESISIKQFVKGLNEEQRISVFGYFTEDGKHNVGIFTSAQVKLFADVGELRVPATALELLLPEGALAITMEQLTLAQAAIPFDQLMPLYAMIKEGQNQRSQN